MAIQYNYHPFTVRNQPVKQPLVNAINAAVTAVYGEGYNVEIRSGQGPHGSRRHREETGGVAADVVVTDPNGRRLSPEELAPLGQHWLAEGIGSVGMPGRGNSNMLHLDLVGGSGPDAVPLQSGEGRFWFYGNPSETQRQAINAGVQGTVPTYRGPTSPNPPPRPTGTPLDAVTRMAGDQQGTAMGYAPTANQSAGLSLLNSAQGTLSNLSKRNSPPALGPAVAPVTSGTRGGSLNTTSTAMERPRYWNEAGGMLLQAGAERTLSDLAGYTREGGLEPKPTYRTVPLPVTGAAPFQRVVNRDKGAKLASDAQSQLSRMAADPTMGLKPPINTTAGFNSAFANTGLRQAIAAALPSTGMPADGVQTPRLADVGSQLPVPGGPPMRPTDLATGGPVSNVVAQPGSPEMARYAALYAPMAGAQASMSQPASPGSTLNAPGRNMLSGGNYQVQRGDTASSIAQRNNITLNQLLQLNPGISNPNQIYAGESLNIPQAANVNSSPTRNSLNTTNTRMGSTNTIRANVAGTRTNVTKTAPGVYHDASGRRVYRQH